MSKKNKVIATVIVIVIFVGFIALKSKPQSEAKSASSKSSSSTYFSIKDKASNKKNAETETSKTNYENTANELNSWYKNTMQKTIENDYNSSNSTYNTDLFKKSSVLIGFKNDNGQLLALVDNNRMKAENYTQKDMAQFAFNSITSQYDKSDDLKIFRNYKEGFIEKPSISDIGIYVELK